MVKPEDIPESVPEMDELTPEQVQSVTDLLAGIKEASGGSYPFLFAREEHDEARRDLAYKFLKARRWKLKDAMTMMTNTLAFRKENGLDQWRVFPSAFPLLGFDEADIISTIGNIPGAEVPLDGREAPTEWDMCYRALQSSYVNVYHYWDKQGHPVLFDCCGRADVGGILKRLEKATPVGKGLKDVIVPYHTYMNEVQYYIIRYANAKARARAAEPAAGVGSAAAFSPTDAASGCSTSRPATTANAKKSAEAPRGGAEKIMGITVVLNAEGMHFGMLQKRFINVVRAIFSVDQSYYPEVLHRLFVINCPGLIQRAYSFVKGNLDENTRRKVVFCSKSESLEGLRRFIDEDKIPQELGGGCRCVGGCLPRYQDDEEAAVRADGKPNPQLAQVEVPTENLTIKAGKKLAREIPVRSGDEISWQFALESADIHFSATFEPGAAAADARSPASAASVDGSPTKELKSKDKTSKSKNAAKGTAAWDELKSEKLDGDVDSFIAKEDGVLHLLWDNHSSWVKSKKMQLRVLNGPVE